jgi:hypothetical protein
VFIHKWSFCPISALYSKNNPRNILYRPAAIFLARLDLEQKSSFMEEHFSVSFLVSGMDTFQEKCYLPDLIIKALIEKTDGYIN